MFRSFIYLDQDKLYAYKSIIDGKLSPQLKEMKKTKKVSAGFDAYGAGIGVSSEGTITGEFTKNPDYDYNEFEESLDKIEGEDYFDFIMNSDVYDLTSVPSMKLIRINSTFSIPEQFDLVNLIDLFKPMLMGKIETKTSNEQEALNNFIGNASADIPVVLEFDDVIIAGKLNAKSLSEDYTSLEEYSDQEVTFLCKVVGVSRCANVEIFNPLKDFIRLNRTLRRSMENSPSNNIGLEPIIVEGPVLKVEIIAIYK